MKRCPECKGAGEIHVHHEILQVCETCGGAGTIPKAVKTDQQTDCLHPNDPDCTCWNCVE